MPKISIAAIVKNEAINIPDFLATIEGVADELVIVDTGSTDNTVELIRQAKTSYPIRLYEQKFEPFHFGRAINSALDRCNFEYVLFLEADHRLGEGFARIRELLARVQPDTVEFRLIDDILPNFKVYRERLYKKGIRYGEDEESAIDPVLMHKGEPAHFDVPIYHLQGGKFKIRRKSQNHSRTKLRAQHIVRTRSRIREIIRGILAFYYLFKKIYFKLDAWKDGWEGFRYAYMQAQDRFMVHYYVSQKPLEKTL